MFKKSYYMFTFDEYLNFNIEKTDYFKQININVDVLGFNFTTFNDCEEIYEKCLIGQTENDIKEMLHYYLDTNNMLVCDGKFITLFGMHNKHIIIDFVDRLIKKKIIEIDKNKLEIDLCNLEIKHMEGKIESTKDYINKIKGN